MTHCKRAAALLLAAVLVLALAACGKQAAAPETTAAPAVEAPAVATPAPTAAPTPAATPSTAGNDGWKAEFEKSLLSRICAFLLDKYPPGVYIQNTPKGYLENHEVLIYGR